MKIINSTALFADAINVNDFKKIKNPTAQDTKKLFNGLTAFSAVWSTGSLAKQHQLINLYLEAALVRKELKDKFAAASAARILQDRSKKQ